MASVPPQPFTMDMVRISEAPQKADRAPAAILSITKELSGQEPSRL